MKLLMTPPGVNFPVAETILSTFGDWKLFPEATTPPHISDLSHPLVNPLISVTTAILSSKVNVPPAGC